MTKNLIMTATGRTIEVTTHRYENKPRKQVALVTSTKVADDGSLVITTITLGDEERRSLIKLLSGKAVD